MKLLGKTDPGKVRKTNQDSFALHEFHKDCQYALVCDGMGGHNGGNVASELAVVSIENLLESSVHAGVESQNVQELLFSVIEKANDMVLSASLKDDGLKGMGTTVVLAFRLDQSIYIAHIGDSRAYLRRNDRLERLTKDHSLVQDMIDRGELTPEQAAVHPYRHVITRVVGVSADAESEVSVLRWQPGDRILLCSDGLSSVLTDHEIFLMLSLPEDEICDRLISAANERGGPDNITVALMILDEKTED